MEDWIKKKVRKRWERRKNRKCKCYKNETIHTDNGEKVPNKTASIIHAHMLFWVIRYENGSIPEMGVRDAYPLHVPIDAHLQGRIQALYAYKIYFYVHECMGAIHNLIQITNWSKPNNC